MTQELFTKFAEIVSNGQIKGVEYAYGDIFIPDKILVATVDLICVAHGSKEGWKETQYTTILCHHIREWLTGQDIYWNLDPDLLIVRLDGDKWYDQGPELDWHLAAVVDICAGKVTP